VAGAYCVGHSVHTSTLTYYNELRFHLKVIRAKYTVCAGSLATTGATTGFQGSFHVVPVAVRPAAQNHNKFSSISACVLFKLQHSQQSMTAWCFPVT